MRDVRGGAGFTLVELLVVVAIVGILAGLAVAAIPQVVRLGDQMDSGQRLRSLGQAMELYAQDHGDRFPGPLWPGQVPEYDPEREGRLVRELADYLGIERRGERYVVEEFVPRAVRREMSGRNLAEVRVYVMRGEVPVGSGMVRPFGRLAGAREEPGLRGGLGGLEAGREWMVAEADQAHPVVAMAPWREFTVREPLHGGRRAVLFFDGAVGMEEGE